MRYNASDWDALHRIVITDGIRGIRPVSLTKCCLDGITVLSMKNPIKKDNFLKRQISLKRLIKLVNL